MPSARDVGYYCNRGSIPCNNHVLTIVKLSIGKAALFEPETIGSIGDVWTHNPFSGADERDQDMEHVPISGAGVDVPFVHFLRLRRVTSHTGLCNRKAVRPLNGAVLAAETGCPMKCLQLWCGPWGLDW